MKIKFLLCFSFMLSCQVHAASSLACSANGLKILYINGVNVDLVDNANTNNNIRDTLFKTQEEYDSNEIHIKKHIAVWNSSRNLINDVEELKVELAANHTPAARFQYWQKIAENLIFEQSQYRDDSIMGISDEEKKKVNEALRQITSGKNIPVNSDGSINQDSFSQSDLYKDLVKYNVRLANLLANASSDVAVVEQLKLKIKEAYNMGDYKLIVVAHSQGNEVLYSAIKALRSDSTFLKTANEVKKFDGLVGYVQVAPPSPELVTINNNPINYYQNHAQYIRHNRDGVIGLSELMTGVKPKDANYTAEIGMPPGGLPSFISEVTHYLDNFFTTYVNSGVFTLYHGMDDTYLSTTYSATRNSTGINKSLAEHFKDNMREIASTLQDNCDLPIISLSSSDGEFIDPATFNMSGFSGANAFVKFKASDLNDKDTIKTTQFSWTFSEFGSGSSTPHTAHSAAPTDSLIVATPFNDIDVHVGITATDKNGKTSSRGFVIKNLHNNKPHISDLSTTCKLGSDGTYSNLYEYSYRVEDDGKVRLLEHSGITTFYPVDGEKSFRENDSSGEVDEVFYQNPCTNNFHTGSISVICQGNTPFVHVTAFSSLGYPDIFFKKDGIGIGPAIYKADIGGRVVDFSAPINIIPGSNEVFNIEAFVTDPWDAQVHSAGTVEVKACN